MLYNLSNKRFKHFWFALMYVAFLLVGIIYSCTLFTHSNPKTETWQDVANYDFELLNRTFADGILTNTYGISTPEQLAGVFNDKFPGIGGGTIIKPPDLGDIGDIIDRPPIIVGPGAGGIEIGGSGDTSIVDLDDIQKVDNVYTLLNDIDLTEKNYTWEILDTFSGKFNGNYHTIKGLTIKESVEAVGMVGELSSGGEIKNLFLDDVDISNETSSSKTTYTGTVSGINNGTIYNVHVTSGTVVGHSKSGDTRYVGGIVGYNDTDGKIRTCSNRALIMNGNYIGGISGYNIGTIGGSSNDNTYACFNYGTITNAFSTGSSYAGGITGYSTKSISLCYNSGSITNNDYSTKRPYAGGIVGRTSGAIDQCANVGTIVSGIDKYTSGYFNGQPQFSDSKVEKSYSGGIAGYASASISNCYNTGYVSANAKNTITNGTQNKASSDVNKYKQFHLNNNAGVDSYMQIFNYEYKDVGNVHNDDYYRDTTNIPAYAGGIVGYGTGKCSSCYNQGGISGGYNKVEYRDVVTVEWWYNALWPAGKDERAYAVFYVEFKDEIYYSGINGKRDENTEKCYTNQEYGLNSSDFSIRADYSNFDGKMYLTGTTNTVWFTGYGTNGWGLENYTYTTRFSVSNSQSTSVGNYKKYSLKGQTELWLYGDGGGASYDGEYATAFAGKKQGPFYKVDEAITIYTKYTVKDDLTPSDLNSSYFVQSSSINNGSPYLKGLYW